MVVKLKVPSFPLALKLGKKGLFSRIIVNVEEEYIHKKKSLSV